MKKILTFLMMFAMTAGILSAQNTNLSYQVVVRDANNNLVVNQKVKVEVVITANSQISQGMVDVVSDYPDGFRYDETIEEDSTNANGMLSLSIGQNGDNPFMMMDWSTAVISLNIYKLPNEEAIMTIEEPVYAVPYALQSGFLLTTPQIVDYITAEIGNGQQDVEAIVAALRDNPRFLEAIRDTVVEYVKNHYDISKRVIRHYMHEVSGNDVRHAYNYYERRLDPEAKDEILKCVKNYLRRHRSMAMELAKYYLRTTNAAEIDALYNELTENNQEVYDFMKSKVDVVLDEYMASKGFNCLREHNFSNLCDLQAAAASMNNDPNDTCPRIISFVNTANDGLMALALNGGVIMTAYVKNYSTSKVSGYGIDLNATGETATARPNVQYISLNGNFGKLVDTMAETGYCREHLYAKAYLTPKAGHPCATEYNYASYNYVTEKTDEYVVPGYTMTIQKEGNTLKAVFSPNEAQQFFSSQRPNNIQWFVDGATTPAATGMTFELPANYTTIKAHAFLRDCTYDAQYPNN